MAIKSFSHKGLKNYFYDNNAKGLNPNHVQKIGFILDAIDSSHHPQDLKVLYLNQFSEKKGSGEGVYSIEINGNWRITFQIKDEGAILLDYVDYHGKKIKAR
ncbi:type II toxin-antitoxin system RelE/ParE family toxin [Shewanella psychromarinicola]|uniref:Plasmid maintenance system killer n=1 Tax=Shewanella psychromarinicola TaxID=2487742 RepID=A0A3N4E869_9GAMM|nr:type II toxin-antitoxin system RelE/ParE family toxin [Shewanella psychromarinicola]AZG36430.1 plasmid maintenance system killer [Shewanella psychromarinicola]MCL1084250.1 type II toxin-antitoxin system RelE/ParE family toxin [Shewanella psychromarinicola]RPA34273.1 plasmid maintenance system killer [Shewanella psychromarinicola]